METLLVKPENAARVREWLETRGGVLIWSSIDLSDPGWSCLTPAITDGSPTKKPSWKAGNDPKKVTDISEVVVAVPKLVQTLRIALRMGSNGLKIKLTDSSSRKVRAALERAGDGSYYEFGGFDGRDCYVYSVGEKIPMLEYKVN